MKKVNRKERGLSLQKDILRYLEEKRHQLSNEIDPVQFTDCILYNALPFRAERLVETRYARCS